MANVAHAVAPPALLTLREEIAIFPGPTALDGSPSWTLHDPARNRFYRLGWQEFEILSRWDLHSADEITQRINTETTLQVDAEDVDQLARFLFAHDLLRAAGPQATAHLLRQAAHIRHSWARWLLHNYLFMRVPLVRPDRALTAAYPLVRWMFSRAFATAIVAIGLVGLYLILRQWDTFRATFVDLFTVQGAIWFAVTLACLKVVHELGHAFTAKRFGCRVPSMGLAILVLVPVLYTDVNDAWKLTARRQRLAIGIAGVTAELCCAAIAACAWGFLPNGPARSAAFLVATSTWLTTVLLNLSPFMRYDGYYVLSDWLETPNLHHRAFALARWWLREKLLGLGDPVPEELPARRRTFLIAFAFLTWTYRFVLFLAIAAIVYHFVVKVLGVAMVVVEIGYFIAWPVVRELITWFRRRRDVRLTPRTLTTAGIAAVILAALLVPWRTSIEAPAVLKSEQHVDVFVPEFGARVVSIEVKDGQQVVKGTPIAHLASPDLDYRLTRLQSEIETLEWQISARGLDPELLARSQVTEREYATALAELRGLRDQKSRLDVTAPIAGKAVDLAPNLEPGMWLPPKSKLLSLIEPGRAVIEAYVEEADLARLSVGDSARFLADVDTRIEVPCRIAEIARASTRTLPEPALASLYGGPIEVRAGKENKDKEKELIPDRTIYRLRLAPIGEPVAFERVLRGEVILRGEPVSLAARAWRAMLAVFIRESGA